MSETLDPLPDATSTATPTARGRLVFDATQCRTCKVCEMACSIAKEGRSQPSLARMNVFFDEFKEENAVSGMICYQCEDAPCMAACPSDAMMRDERTGAVLIIADKCTGCMRCRRACPWDVPKLNREARIAVKCDLCYDRATGPVCVMACPLKGKALRYEPDYYLSQQ